ncbi:MAG: hypothetical protein P4M05_27085 [Bradyrhizobium sp.]|nr:hypothetical protein [Bradyrhizobium sp.]
MLRISALLMAVIAAGWALTPPRAHAQWWGKRAPADYEECADAAEKATTREAKAAALIECNAKFAGRRKPGGGYTYFDFMQNRTFDIAGPNPTPQEQKHIDEQYTEFLDREHQSNIAAALAAKQQQQQVQQATFKSETEKVPMPIAAPNKPSVASGNAKRLKASNCASHSFSCDWPRLSEGLNDLKKALFGSSSTKDKRG